MSHSNFTGRHHRTMKEAFGPYDCGQIDMDEDDRFYRVVEWCMWGMAAVAALGVCAVLFL